ncbi:ABC transporter substrate-binding protein [Microbacterium gorillae]|uniref:ABC transporter substrate-binding protein n=1 Tax=Microbacterium gorillae TaxID=1231063 RepID=UPI003D97B3E7
MKTRPLLATLTLGALSVGLLAGCTPSADNGGDVSSLTLWHNSADSPALLQLYKDFETESGIAIELVDIPSDAFETTTLTKFATGDRPDLLEYHPNISAMLTLNPEQNMQDLSDMDFVHASGDTYESSGSYRDKVYAAILGFPSIFGVFYNKQVLDENGLQPPTNFDDLHTICAALRSTDVAPIWESGGSAWPTQVLPLLYVADANDGGDYGWKVASNETALNEPGGAFSEALDAYQSLADGGCLNANATSATFEDGLRAVYDGEAAMTALHSDTYAALLGYAEGDGDALSARVGFVPVSARSAVATYASGPLGTYYAPKTGDPAKEAAAREFIAFATGAGYQKFIDDAQAFPVISTAQTPDGFSGLQLDFQAAYAGKANIAFNSNIAGFGGFAAETTKLLAGQATPQQVADSMVAQVEQASKAAGVDGW